jgi:hypothetical protein
MTTTASNKKTKKKAKKVRKKRGSEEISENRLLYNKLNGIYAEPRIPIDEDQNPAWFQALSVGDWVVAKQALSDVLEAVDTGDAGYVAEDIFRDEETNEILGINVQFPNENVAFEYGQHPIGHEISFHSKGHGRSAPYEGDGLI